MRTKMIAGNWKMFKGIAQTREFINGLEEWLKADGKPAAKAARDKRIEIVIAPSYTSIAAAVAARSSGYIHIAAQNAHNEPKGAFTGEVSMRMLQEAGCQYVLVGHSERRNVFHETDDFLYRKLLAALESGVLPIFCVGEQLDDRMAGRTEAVLKAQLDAAAKTLTSDVMGKMVTIAYEPTWAIGTGKTASDKDAEEACEYLRELIADKFGLGASESLRILYGGSVKPENSRGLLSQPNIDGLLIGGASLDLDSYEKIIETAL